MRFKRFLISCVCCLLFIVSVNARNVKFIYIAHDVESPVEKLMKKIERYHDDLDPDDTESNDRTIVYISSGDNPIIADMRSGNLDEDNYERVMHEFERNYHDVDAEVDIDKVIELFSEDDFLDASGRLDVNDITFEFYVTPIYWVNNQHQKFIASLYYAFGLDKFNNPKSPFFTRDMSFTVYLPTLEDMRKCKGAEGKPFGELNINNINEFVGTNGFIGSYE